MKNVTLSLLCVCLFGLANSIDAQDKIAKEKKLDFGDASSETLTTKAWKALEAKKYKETIVFTKKCIELYEKDAKAMQAELKEPVDASDKDAVSSKWALNDVGTCYFVMGQTFEKMGDKKKAIEAYKQIGKKVAFAQCWDEKGWFWKPIDAAKKQIKVLEFELAEEEDDKPIAK